MQCHASDFFWPCCLSRDEIVKRNVGRTREKKKRSLWSARFSSRSRRALALLQIHVEEAVARVARHVIMHEQKLLVVMCREVTHRLLKLRNPADELLDFAHATFASDAGDTFGFVARLRTGGFFRGTGVASSLVAGVISSGACSSSGTAASAGSVIGSFRRLDAICAYSGLISTAMKWRFICWHATAVVPLPTNGSKTVSPSVVYCSKRYRSRRTGFCVGWGFQSWSDR